ncbi:unnamed protein product [Calypogeia fissa]
MHKANPVSSQAALASNANPVFATKSNASYEEKFGVHCECCCL